jgi:hypothetical protein
MPPAHPSDETDWDILGIPAQAIEAHLKDVRESVRAKLVCVCGHAVNKHTSTDGHVFCRTARMFCPCETITPVVQASDTRYFMTKTRDTERGTPYQPDFLDFERREALSSFLIIKCVFVAGKQARTSSQHL